MKQVALVMTPISRKQTVVFVAIVALFSALFIYLGYVSMQHRVVETSYKQPFQAYAQENASQFKSRQPASPGMRESSIRKMRGKNYETY